MKKENESKNKTPTIVGLIISLVLPVLLILNITSDIIRKLPDFLNGIGFWILTIILIVIILLWEKKSLSSIGLKRISWKTFVSGFGFAFAVIMSYPFVAILVQKLGLMGSEAGLEEMTKYPTWILIIFCVQAGLTEEILYRAYPMERLLTWSKSKLLAMFIPLIIFILLHLPFWGPGHLIFVAIAGIIFSIQYIWLRDLTANILAHFLVDFFGLIIYPMLSSS